MTVRARAPHVALVAALLALHGWAARAQTSVGDAPAPPAPADRAGGVPQADEGEAEAAARTRIEGAGYSDVTGLRRDGEGVWRGRASRGGNPVEVSVDRLGHVTATPAAR